MAGSTSTQADLGIWVIRAQRVRYSLILITPVGEFPSAFDPIFMLHHTNVSWLSRFFPFADMSKQVDRLLALWQALHPGIWISDKGKEGNFFKKGQSSCFFEKIRFLENLRSQPLLEGQQRLL